jgi:protein-S-isoprenylcysteine O-methyltransferase Ste14
VHEVGGLPLRRAVASRAALTHLLVVATWLAFGAAFVARPRQPGGKTAKRAPLAMVGMVLQALAYSVVWSAQGLHLAPPPAPVRWVGVVVNAGGAAVVWAAVRHLGKQWALQARVLEGHELVTSGPYAYVRHPIYSAMFLMLIGTGLVVSTWEHLAVALPLFLAGTALRTRLEERLLRDVFGERFEAYRRTAGWLLPRPAPPRN